MDNKLIENNLIRQHDLMNQATAHVWGSGSEPVKASAELFLELNYLRNEMSVIREAIVDVRNHLVGKKQ